MIATLSRGGTRGQLAVPGSAHQQASAAAPSLATNAVSAASAAAPLPGIALKLGAVAKVASSMKSLANLIKARGAAAAAGAASPRGSNAPIVVPGAGKVGGPAVDGASTPNHRRASIDFRLVTEVRIPKRQLRLNDPQSRLTFLKEHPFFQGTSSALRERLAPQLVKRSAEHDGAEILMQGVEPEGNMDYLFLTAPDSNARVEVFFEGRPIGILGGSSIFGQEVVFGVTKRFVFSVRVAAGSTSALWVVPRSILQAVLQRDACKADAPLLRERAHTSTAALLHNWLLLPTTPIRLRLFENAAHDFKSTLVEASEVELIGAGTSLRPKAEDKDTCFCVFRGDAKVTLDGQEVAKLSHAHGTNAWNAWWGMLEVLGVPPREGEEVVAVTDCIIWRIGADKLPRLRKPFPQECRLFEKVANEHMKLLQKNTTTRIGDAAVFKDVRPSLLEELAAAAVPRIYRQGDSVIAQGEESDDVFFVARGRLAVMRNLAGSLLLRALDRSGAPQKRIADDGSRPGTPVSPALRGTQRVAVLGRAAIFGEAEALGLRAMRGASVICDTCCDIRVLPQRILADVLAQDSLLSSRFLDMAKARGAVVPQVGEDLAQLKSFKGISRNLLSAMQLQMKSKTAFKSQVLLEQREEADALVVLLSGSVSLETNHVKLAEIEAPGMFGDNGLVQPGSKNIATIRCHTFCQYLTIPVRTVSRLLEEHPQDKKPLLANAAANVESLRVRISTSSNQKDAVALQKGQLQDAPDILDSGPSKDEGEMDEVLFRDVLEKFFKGSDRRFYEFLVQGMQKTIYYDGQIILSQGEEGDFAMIIHRGCGVVEVGGIRVGEVKEGGLIGESVLVGASAVRTATVRAVGLVSAVILPQWVVLAAFQEFPEEKRRIEEIMRLRDQANKVLTAAAVSPVPPPTPDAGGGGNSIFGSLINTPSAGTGESKERRISWNPSARRTSKTLEGALMKVVPSTSPRRRPGSGTTPKRRRQEATPRRIIRMRSHSPGSSDSSESASMVSQASHRESTVSGKVTTSAPGGSSNSSGPGGRRKHLEWARRRQEAVKAAEMLRAAREGGAEKELVPASHGYRVPPKVGATTPWAARPADDCAAAATVPWKLRLKRTEGIYKPPVWHEVFGS